MVNAWISRHGPAPTSVNKTPPIEGPMTGDEFHSVVERMRLPDGSVFPLPVVLDVDEEVARAVRGRPSAALVFEGVQVGAIEPSDDYSCDRRACVERIFGTADEAHAGVAHFLRMKPRFLGGPVHLTRRVQFDFSEYELTPAETRAHFRQRAWSTVAGFQTRNVPHRAHEHLQRLALTLTDGLFIQPLVGRKKRGDYEPAAILAGYRALLQDFLPSERILLGVLSTYMRYAGPREAVFHALIRRNYGCTHFVVGRDHAGVGGYYREYEAQELAKGLSAELGIQILDFPGPYLCRRCGGTVTERCCPHKRTDPRAVRAISGTLIRAALSGDGSSRDADLADIVRPEVVAAIRGMNAFIEEDEP